MIKRTIDICKASYVHLKNKQLLIDQHGETVGRVPVEDLGILVLEHPAIVISQAAIIECQKNNVAIVFCDEKHLPYATLLPIYEGNQLHNKVLRQQVQISQPTRKRIWKEIVQQKIRNQAQTLQLADKPFQELIVLAKRVKSGDSENLEAVAARKYWQLLMGKGFKRNPAAEGVNALLNYGYSIIRAMIARALVGTGLHPAIGLFHHNQYDGLALANDIMEPLRPRVDLCVVNNSHSDREVHINQESKKPLLELLAKEVQWKGKKMPLMVVSHLLAAELKRAYENSNQSIQWPEWINSIE